MSQEHGERERERWMNGWMDGCGEMRDGVREGGERE